METSTNNTTTILETITKIYIHVHGEDSLEFYQGFFEPWVTGVIVTSVGLSNGIGFFLLAAIVWYAYESR